MIRDACPVCFWGKHCILRWACFSVLVLILAGAASHLHQQTSVSAHIMNENIKARHILKWNLPEVISVFPLIWLIPMSVQINVFPFASSLPSSHFFYSFPSSCLTDTPCRASQCLKVMETASRCYPLNMYGSEWVMMGRDWWGQTSLSELLVCYLSFRFSAVPVTFMCIYLDPCQLVIASTTCLFHTVI